MHTRPDKLTSSTYGRRLEALLDQAAGYALSILRNRSDAEDAVQQAALRGLQRIATYDSSQPFKAWWFAVLRNCCIDLLRSKRPHAALDQAAVVVARPAESADWRELADALDRLETAHEEILRLRYFGGLSYEEIAHALEIPRGTVMSRLYYARKALAAHMKEFEQ